MAEAAGASYVGAMLVPGSPRVVSAQQAASISGSLSVPLVIVTADLMPAEVARSAIVSRARVIQLHGDESPAELTELRRLGSWELWKAIRVRSSADITRAIERFAEVADLVLLDAWHPTELGGTGTRFPWEALASLRDDLGDQLRLGVCGGLSPENVAEAVTRLRPDLVDVSSGVERQAGVKDPDRIRAFVRRALEANAEASHGSGAGNPDRGRPA